MHIIITGNPVNGFGFTGPFPERDDAIEWGEAHLDDSWWISPVDAPVEYRPRPFAPVTHAATSSTIIKAQQDMIDVLTSLCDRFTDLAEMAVPFATVLSDAEITRETGMISLAREYRRFIAEA